jgi:UDP-N-acetylmuramoyl-L-alanyl-D-glutamate--2,6-diaminopimelate ligase
MRVSLSTPRGEVRFTTALQGSFNLYNLMAAAGVGLAAGRDRGEIAAGLGRVKGVPGRFESVDRGQPFRVIVDYAHTPDALRNVLKTAREITHGRLYCVVGCGGDRDRGKRPQMGCAAEELSDRAFFTSDNPRTEAPGAILEEILSGVTDRRRATVIENRAEAIAAALDAASVGDTVVIAGKGHEDYQIVGTVKHPFDDRRIAADILESKYHGTATP